jgi:hypothetical protein
MASRVLDREEELAALRRRLQNRRSFLLHGPGGAGKTLLLNEVVPDLPGTLYCRQSSSVPTVFRTLAAELVKAGDRRALAKLGATPAETIRTKSALAIKGLVTEALREGSYCVVLDHLGFSSQSFAAAIKELAGWAATPVVAATRSCHMEDVGFLMHLYPGRSDRMELRNFEAGRARRFAQTVAAEGGLTAENLAEFIERAVNLSGGNPGAILSLVELAKQPKYRSEGQVKITPLYIDFRLRWDAASHG